MGPLESSNNAGMACPTVIAIDLQELIRKK